MNRTIYIACSFLTGLLFNSRAFGQTTPVLGGVAPFVNEKEFVTLYKTSGGIDEGLPGDAASWNFSSYPVYKSAEFDYISPLEVSQYASFMNTKMVYKEPLSNADTLFTFLEDSLIGSYFLRILGSYQVKNKMLLTYSNPKFLFPKRTSNYKYGDSISSSYSAFGTYDSSGISGTINRHGTYKTKYDGYGDLITNYGNIGKVSRLKSEDTYTDSITISGKLSVVHYSVTAFDWYNYATPGIKLVHIEHININGKLSDYGYSECVKCPVASVNEIELHSENISVYPQPVNTEANIRISFGGIEKADLKLFDNMGRSINIKISPISNNGNEYNLDCTFLENGLYYLYISKDNFKKVVKLSINHKL